MDESGVGTQDSIMVFDTTLRDGESWIALLPGATGFPTASRRIVTSPSPRSPAPLHENAIRNLTSTP